LGENIKTYITKIVLP